MGLTPGEEVTAMSTRSYLTADDLMFKVLYRALKYCAGDLPKEEAEAIDNDKVRSKFYIDLTKQYAASRVPKIGGEKGTPPTPHEAEMMKLIAGAQWTTLEPEAPQLLTNDPVYLERVEREHPAQPDGSDLSPDSQIQNTSDRADSPPGSNQDTPSSDDSSDQASPEES